MPGLEGKRIVICEDEGITQMQLQHAFDRAGATVVGSAVNGQEAVKVVLRERPDLVLMDIKMPGLDGIEAARRILALYPVCIVVLSAYSEEPFMEQAFEAGVAAYLGKPISTETLLPLVEDALEVYSQRRHAQGTRQ